MQLWEVSNLINTAYFLPTHNESASNWRFESYFESSWALEVELSQFKLLQDPKALPWNKRKPQAFFRGTLNCNARFPHRIQGENCCNVRSDVVFQRCSHGIFIMSSTSPNSLTYMPILLSGILLSSNHYNHLGAHAVLLGLDLIFTFSVWDLRKHFL